MVVGPTRCFGIVNALPGFTPPHNQRMLIYVLLALALLAGWGLDELIATGAPPLRRARLRAARPARRSSCVPVARGWSRAGTLASASRHGLDVAWGFADPPRDRSTRTTAQADVVRMSALLQWLPLGGAGLALVAWRLPRAPGSAGGPSSALAVALLSRSTCSAPTWATTRRSRAQRRAARRRPARSSYLQSRAPNRFVGLEPADRLPAAAAPTWRCATGSTTRAATTSRRRSATTSSGGARRAGRRPTSPSRSQLRGRHAGGPARAEPAQRLRPPPHAGRGRSAARAARRLPRPRRAWSTATSDALPRCSSSGAPAAWSATTRRSCAP